MNIEKLLNVCQEKVNANIDSDRDDYRAFNIGDIEIDGEIFKSVSIDFDDCRKVTKIKASGETLFVSDAQKLTEAADNYEAANTIGRNGK